MAQQMPHIDLSKAELTDEELELAKGIINTRTGQLRASKPTVNRFESGRDKYNLPLYDTDDTGKTAYIWRMVAFYVSPRRTHQCMPVMAFCDIPGSVMDEGRKALEAHLDDIAKRIADTVPATQWHSLRVWGPSLGKMI